MSKEKYLQFIASFIVVLVLTLPFYTTSVYATISSVSIKGSDGVEGFARTNDFLNFNVQATLANATVTSSQVLLGLDTAFDRCTASINNAYECTLRFPGNGTAPFDSKSVPFTINLLKSDNAIDDSKSGTITVDDRVPQVALTSQSTFSSQQSVVINYDVTDFACNDPSCDNKCVGIKKIKFYTQDLAFQQEINPTTADCNIKSSISIDPKTFSNGQNSVFATATDKFDQVSAETSVTFNVDAAGPQIMQDSFAILSKGVVISSFSTNSAPVDVIVNVSASDLDFNSVTADLSALNPSGNLKNAKASCTSVDSGLSVCKWHVDLNPKTPGLKTIVINASDTLGNEESATINKQLALDDQGPVVQSLSTSETAAQVLAKSSGNSIIAVFDEATGLSPSQIFLHIDDTKIAATSCSKDASWNCEWDNVNFGSSKSRISIEPDTTDILGNPVAETFSEEVAIDNKPPVLNSINISPVGGQVQAFPGFAKIGDKIAVVANLTEDNDVSAVADFSKFVSGASKVAGSCERVQADEHICTWLTDSVDLQNNDAITFNFSDNAGNTLAVAKSFKTYGLENATVPNFWSSQVACSPSTIDRQLGPLINQRVFCQVSLTQKSTTKPVSTVFIGPAGCSGSSIVQSVDTLNTQSGTTSPVIKITFNKDDFRIDGANLTCSFDIYSKIGSGTTITVNPEVENVNIPVQFSNFPLGEVGSEVQRKIDDSVKEAQGIYKTIGQLNKIMNVAKKICQLLQTIYNIVAVLYFITHALNSADIAAQGTFLGIFTVKPVAQAQCGLETNARQVTGQSFLEWGNKFCRLVNCQTTILWGPQVQNWINNKAPLYISPGQYLGPKTEIQATKPFGQEVVPVGNGKSISSYDYVRDISIGSGNNPRPVSEYMDPQHNLFAATLFACIPGIIYGLDKYRQIKCLYADCLQNAVGKEGLPVSACEDQKAYATCKYVTGELFAVFPWTAVFDHFISIIKNALSNPLSLLGIGIALGCQYTCSIPEGTSRQSAWTACETFRLLNQIGYVADNVKNIIDEGFKVRQDYCTRIDTKK